MEPPLSLSMIHDSQQLHKWIDQNKPHEDQAIEISNLFLDNASIKGSQEFISQIEDLTDSISKNAFGYYLLRNINANCPSIDIEETVKKNYCNAGRDKPIALNFKCKLYELYETSDGERVFIKFSKKLQFIHQLIHKKHYVCDAENYEVFDKLPSNIPKKGGMEEELTITGALNYKKSKHRWQEICCENSARVELGLPCRLTYNGIVLDSKLTLEDMIKWRAVGNLREWLKKNRLKKEDRPLAYLSRRLKKSNMSEKEWPEMINLLVENGAKFSNSSLKRIVALDASEIIQFILDENICPAEKMLELAFEVNNSRLLHGLLSQGIKPSEKFDIPAAIILHKLTKKSSTKRLKPQNRNHTRLPSFNSKLTSVYRTMSKASFK